MEMYQVMFRPKTSAQLLVPKAFFSIDAAMGYIAAVTLPNRFYRQSSPEEYAIFRGGRQVQLVNGREQAVYNS